MGFLKREGFFLNSALNIPITRSPYHKLLAKLTAATNVKARLLNAGQLFIDPAPYTARAVHAAYTAVLFPFRVEHTHGASERLSFHYLTSLYDLVLFL